MNLPVIEMEKEQAEAALADYRSAVTAGSHDKMNEARRDYEKMDRAIKRGYREIAKGNRLIRLSEAILSGGVQDVHWEQSHWTQKDGSWVTNEKSLFPRLAVVRADARLVLSRGIDGDGEVSFRANEQWPRSQKDRIDIAGFQRPAQDYRPQNHKAIVPMIPPLLRPPHNLRNYHILWEAEWEIATRTPPGDPALLKQLEGDLYVVLAVWDLSELERAVLGGMRGE